MKAKAQPATAQPKPSERPPKLIGDILGKINAPSGQSLRNSDLLGKRFTIHGITSGISQFGDFRLLDITVDDKRVSWITSAMHVVQQLEEIKTQLPVMCKLDKAGRTYFLNNP